MKSEHSPAYYYFFIVIISVFILLSSCLEIPTVTTSFTPTAGVTAIKIIQPTSTVKPTVKVVTSTPKSTVIVPTRTPTPTSPQVLPEIKFKIAYLIKDFPSDRKTTNPKIMQIIYPEQIITELYEYPLGSSYGIDQNWSNNGQWLAFRRDENQQLVITIIDTMTLEKKDYFLPVPNPGYKRINTRLCWSLDDRWIAFSVTELDNYERLKTYILDTRDGHSWVLADGVQFVSWSPVAADQYFYIQHTYLESTNPELKNTGPITVHLGAIGSAAPLKSITDMGEYAPPSWFAVAPNADIAIGISHKDGGPLLISLNFHLLEWSRFANFNAFGIPELWSPSGEWLVLWWVKEALILDMITDVRQSYVIPQETDDLYPLGWMKEPELLFYQDGLKIMLLDPELPDKAEFILDLTPLGLDQEIIPVVQFWIANGP